MGINATKVEKTKLKNSCLIVKFFMIGELVC